MILAGPIRDIDVIIYDVINAELIRKCAFEQKDLMAHQTLILMHGGE